MKNTRALWFPLGLVLLLGLGISPMLSVAADPPPAVASPIVGTWEGTLDPGAQPKKTVVVHITGSQDGTLSGTIDYPDQDVSGIIINAITYKEPKLHFESTGIPGFFDGTMNKENSEITGSWNQQGSALGLVLKRTR